MKPFIIISVFLTISLFSQQINGANILFYIGMGSYSHRVPMQPLLEELADRGHYVTMLSGLPPKIPNPKITEFVPPKLKHWMETDTIDVFSLRKSPLSLLGWFVIPGMGIRACESLYSDQEFMNFIKNPETKFEIVVMDSLYNECAYGLAYYFKAKLVAFNTGQLYAWNPETNYGMPDETSSYPDGMLHMPANMNIFQRMATVLIPLVWKLYREVLYFPKLEELTKKSLDLKEIPSFEELEQNTSLFLLNSYWAQEYPRSLPPNVIPIGGIAWNKNKGNKPLPTKLEDFIKKGKEGFIYVSFGTVAEFTKFDPEVRQAFINMIGKFPNIQFIWKSTHPIKEKLPENVLVEKWLPQADILVHPKIRLFVTHGGLGGIYEAIYSKVPMICFPIFAEQEYNANLMEEKGYGIKLEIISLTESEITTAISKMLNDPSYKRQVERVSELLEDRILSPLDTAVWWMEYILRHDHVNELMTPLSVKQSWWVRRQLDAWALIFLSIVIVLGSITFVIYFIVKLILRLICGSSGKNTRKNTKKRPKLD